jgi:hypothetical protein
MIGPSARVLIIATACANLAGAPGAQAASQFDGDWVTHGVTKTGACEPNFQLNGRIVNGAASSLGAAFRVAPSGAVTLTISVGPNHGVATGRMSGASGAGIWRSEGPTGTCTGTWKRSEDEQLPAVFTARNPRIRRFRLHCRDSRPDASPRG